MTQQEIELSKQIAVLIDQYQPAVRMNAVVNVLGALIEAIKVTGNPPLIVRMQLHAIQGFLHDYLTAAEASDARQAQN